MIDIRAGAVERAASTDPEAVVAEPEKVKDEPALFAARTFPPEAHHRNRTRGLTVETEDGTPGAADDGTVSEPGPMDARLAAEAPRAPSPGPSVRERAAGDDAAARSRPEAASAAALAVAVRQRDPVAGEGEDAAIDLPPRAPCGALSG